MAERQGWPRLWACKLANFNETSFEDKVANCGPLLTMVSMIVVEVYACSWQFDSKTISNWPTICQLFVQKLTPLLFPFSTHRTYIRQNSNCWNEILIQVQLTQLPPIKSTNLTTNSYYLRKKLQWKQSAISITRIVCLST